MVVHLPQDLANLASLEGSKIYVLSSSLALASSAGTAGTSTQEMLALPLPPPPKEKAEKGGREKGKGKGKPSAAAAVSAAAVAVSILRAPTSMVVPGSVAIVAVATARSDRPDATARSVGLAATAMPTDGYRSWLLDTGCRYDLTTRSSVPEHLQSMIVPAPPKSHLRLPTT